MNQKRLRKIALYLKYLAHLIEDECTARIARRRKMPDDEIHTDSCDVIGSCDECGCDIYDDEVYGGLCDQCAWWLMQSGEE